jgi:hypothetical protein
MGVGKNKEGFNAERHGGKSAEDPESSGELHVIAWYWRVW